MAMRTPWGTAQSENTIAEGVTVVTTAGHGGIKLDAARNAKVHKAWRQKGGWYEEDAEWAIVALTFPNLFPEAHRIDAHRIGKDYYPDQYEQVFKVKVLAAESYELRERDFRARTADKWVATAAWGYRNDKAGRVPVPEGMTGVVATLGGRRTDGVEERWFLVPAAEYSGLHFVVDEQRHTEWAAVDHELRLVPDDKYRHLFNPQCVGCRWSGTGFVREPIARVFYDRHLPAA